MVSTARTVRDALVPNRPATPGTGAGWRPFQASSEGGGADRGRAPPAADQPVVFFSVSVMMMMMRQDTRRGQVLLGSRGVSFVRGRGAGSSSSSSSCSSPSLTGPSRSGWALSCRFIRWFKL